MEKEFDASVIMPDSKVVEDFLSGIFLGTEEETQVVPWEKEAVSVLVAYFDFGDAPQTGERVIGKFLLSSNGENRRVGFCPMRGRWFSFDPNQPMDQEFTGFMHCRGEDSVILAGDSFEVGRQYIVSVAVGFNPPLDCAKMVERLQEACIEHFAEGYDILELNNISLVEALVSEGPVPEGIMELASIYIPLKGSVEPLP